MDNNSLRSPKELFDIAANGLKDIDSKPLTRANLRHLFASIGLVGLMGWQLGFNVWVVLLFIFLQSLYFFGKKVTTYVFRIEIIAIIVILLSGLAYNVFIWKPGMSDSVLSYAKDKILKSEVDLENPAVDLQARVKGLIKEKASKKLQQHYNDPDSLLKSADEVRYLEDRLYNSLHQKQISTSTASQASSGQTGTKPQAQLSVVNIQQFKVKQVLDTVYYKFILREGQRTSDIILEDQNGRSNWRIFAKNVIATNANGVRQVWYKNIDRWWPVFNLEAVSGYGPVEVDLKIYRAV